DVAAHDRRARRGPRAVHERAPVVGGARVAHRSQHVRERRAISLETKASCAHLAAGGNAEIRSEAGGRSSRRSTIPRSPSTRRRSPVRIASVAPATLTTAGIPYSRATTGACESGP